MSISQELFNILAKDVQDTHCKVCPKFSSNKVLPSFHCMCCLSGKVKSLIYSDSSHGNTDGGKPELEKDFPCYKHDR